VRCRNFCSVTRSEFSKESVEKEKEFTGIRSGERRVALGGGGGRENSGPLKSYHSSYE